MSTLSSESWALRVSEGAVDSEPSLVQTVYCSDGEKETLPGARENQNRIDQR